MEFRKAFWRNWHLISACMRRSSDATLQTARTLIEEGADPNARWRVRGLEWMFPGEQQSALLLACQEGNLRLVRLLLESGARDDRAICVVARNGRTRNKLEIVRLLLGRGLDVRTESGRMALCLAVESRCVDMVELIVRSGADVNFKTPSGRSLLRVAVESGVVDVVRLLVDNGALVDDNTCPPLWTVCPLSAHDPMGSGAADMARLLIRNGVDPNVSDGRMSPLERAVSSRNVELARVLVENGADPSVCDGDGTSLLYKVFVAANVELAKVLLAGGADANVCDDEGTSLFELAVQQGQAEMVKALLEHQMQFLPKYGDY